MLRYVVLSALLLIVAIFIAMTYTDVLNGSRSSSVGPASVPATVYHSLAQHIPKIGTGQH